MRGSEGQEGAVMGIKGQVSLWLRVLGGGFTWKRRVFSVSGVLRAHSNLMVF